jgi:hypothetical protein
MINSYTTLSSTSNWHIFCPFILMPFCIWHFFAFPYEDLLITLDPKGRSFPQEWFEFPRCLGKFKGIHFSPWPVYSFSIEYKTCRFYKFNSNHFKTFIGMQLRIDIYSRAKLMSSLNWLLEDRETVIFEVSRLSPSKRDHGV